MSSVPLLRQLARAAAACSLVSVGACSGITDSTPTINRYGAVNITARSNSATQATAAATVIFFDAFSIAIPNSALQQTDQCEFLGADSVFTEVRGQKRAGAAIALTAGPNRLSLDYSVLLFRYATPRNMPFTYTAGDVAEIAIPGDPENFPAISIGVKLAEPIVPGAIATPAAGEPLTVRWNALNDPSAAVIISLKYASSPTALRANAQIYCAARDDGEFVLPASALTAFQASPPALRSLQLTRWRTNELLIDAATILHIASSVDTVIVLP